MENSGTEADHIEAPDKPLGKELHRRKKKKNMNKLDITKELIEGLSSSQPELLQIAVLEANDNLNVSSLRDLLESEVNEIETELCERNDEDVSVSVDWNEVFESLTDMENTFRENFSKMRSVLEKVDGLETDTINESVALIANSLGSVSKSLKQEIEESNEEEMELLLEGLVDEVEERVESRYMEAVQEWTNEKKEELSEARELKATQSTLNSIVNLLESAGINVDTTGQDRINELEEANQELASKLDEVKDLVSELKKESLNEEKERIFEWVSHGLSSVSKDKLESLAENVPYIDADQYESKLLSLKKTFIASSKTNVDEVEGFEEEETPSKPINESKRENIFNMVNG